MVPLPAVLTLWDAWIHVCAANSCDVLPNIETSIDEYFSIAATLSISYIYPDDSHVRFREYLDYS